MASRTSAAFADFEWCIRSPSWSPIPLSSESMRPRRCSPHRLLAGSACKLSCRPPTTADASPSLFADRRMRSGALTIWRGAGFFARTPRAGDALDRYRDKTCCALVAPAITSAFMRLAVRQPQKHPGIRTHRLRQDDWTKALIREIPINERLITIEDAKELVLDRHPNHVRLFYSKDDQGVAARSRRNSFWSAVCA